jgi:hypothetical protein
MGYTTRRSESSGRTGGSGGGNLSIRWNNRWAPPQGVLTTGRLLPGNYINFEGEESEYFHYVTHFVSRSKRELICSKKYQIVSNCGKDELVDIGGKCLACEEKAKGAEDISWSLKHVFNWLHLANYHKVVAIDKKNGKLLRYSKGPKEGEQIFNDKPCTGRNCEHCQAKLDKFFGNKCHWSLGSGHLNELTGFVMDIAQDCSNCGEGRLSISGYECENCGHLIIDIKTTKMSDEEIRSYTSRKIQCNECKYIGVSIMQTECSHCQDPMPLSIFDCELEIKRQGEGTNSSIQIPRRKKIDVETYVDRIPNLEKLLVPFNFNQVFAPDTFEAQAKILGIRNPYGSENPNADEHCKNYKNTTSSSEIPF